MRQSGTFLFAFILPTVALAQVTITGTTRRLTTDPSSHYGPSISGDIVAYTVGGSTNSEVFFYDLSTNTEYQATASRGGLSQIAGDVSGNLIVYTELSSAGSTVKAFAIAGGTTPLSESYSSGTPGVDGSLVAWQDFASGVGEIVAVDLSAGIPRQLTNGAGNASSSPNVSGRYVVYSTSFGATCQVFVTNFDTLVTTQLTNSPTGCNRSTDISGNHVVYESDRAGDQDIYIYELGTGTETRVGLPGVQQNPHVSGDWVAFEDLTSAGVSSIRLYHIPSGTLLTAVQANTALESASLNDIDGTRVAYTSAAAGNLDIYVFEFSVNSGQDAPVTATGATFDATEGVTFTGTVATFTDPDPASSAAQYSATIDWGDTTPTTSGTISGTGGPFTVSGTHTYAEQGTYTVTVVITDIDTPSNTATAHSTARVSDARLSSTCATMSVSTQTYTGPTAIFTDQSSTGTLSDLSASISWGDSSSSPGTITGGPGSVPYTVSGTHTYASTGTFLITTTIVDSGGSTTTTPACPILVFGTSAGGNFVIGDGNSDVGARVTFWGAHWWKVNTLSGGPAPASFKGFEDVPGSSPACGTNWSTDPGNSTPPPIGPLPAFMAVIVSSSISKSGTTISGDTPRVVVVQTDRGYAPNPGHAGTGKVVAEVCHVSSGS
jgi:beta propeller repeat protein